jgi:hypothetical protein
MFDFVLGCRGGLAGERYDAITFQSASVTLPHDSCTSVFCSARHCIITQRGVNSSKSPYSNTVDNEGGESSRAEGVQPPVEGDGERGVDKTNSNTAANKGGESSRAEGIQPPVEGDGERGVDKTSSNTVANESRESSRAEGVQPLDHRIVEMSIGQPESGTFPQNSNEVRMTQSQCTSRRCIRSTANQPPMQPGSCSL